MREVLSGSSSVAYLRILSLLLSTPIVRLRTKDIALVSGIFELETMPNEFKEIITRLEKQKAAIERVLAALREMDDSGVEEATATWRARPTRVARKTEMSEKGRKRIAEVQRKRWLPKKKAAKRSGRVGAKKAAPFT
jgi:hypothetical protein